MVEKIRSIPIGVRASIAYFVASMVTSGIAYITTPIFTRLLLADEYGKVSLFFTWFQIFGIIAMFCLSYGVFNNGMVEYSNFRDDYTLSILILSNIITIIFTIIVLVLYPLIKNVINLDIELIVIMCILYLFQPAYNFWVARQRYEYKYKAVLICSILCAFIPSIISVICLMSAPKGARLYPRILGAQIPLIVIYIVFYIYTGKKNKWHLELKYWSEAIKFNLPLIPHYLSTFLLGSSDKVMISYLIDSTSTAYYSVAHSVAAIASIVWTAINGSLLPFTYEKCKEEDYESINKVTLPILTVFAVGCLAVIMMAPEVVEIMATKDYMEAIYVIPPIIGGVFFQVQYYVFSNIVYYFKKPVFVMVGSVTAVSLNIVLNYICILKFGYIAAGYTTLVCYCIQAFIDFYAMKKVVGRSVYNTKYFFVLSLIVIFVSLTSNLIYDYAIIRYIIIIIILVVGILKKNTIIGLISATK